MEADIEVRNLAIYVHIPFCKQKCKYCDFNSFYVDEEGKIHQYIKAVCKQIEYYSNSATDFTVTSVYFGGGTPSFIKEKYIKFIMEKIKKFYKVSEDAEITIEVNPGTITLKKLKKYREIGINRISIGVQTLNDKLLMEIGRIHTAQEARECFHLAREAGFYNISMDIMFGLPDQEIKDIENTLDEFMSFNPEHISAYSLKVEAGTVFGKLYAEKKLNLPSESSERDMYYLIKRKLKKFGYNQYEISNFSKPGYESKHNMAYWKRQDYLGVGISAASCFNEVRFTNTYNFLEYINNPIDNFSESEILTEDVIESERIILGLRLLEGVNEGNFNKKEWKQSLKKLIEKGLLTNSDGKIILTDKGLDLANQVFVEFI